MMITNGLNYVTVIALLSIISGVIYFRFHEMIIQSFHFSGSNCTGRLKTNATKIYSRELLVLKNRFDSFFAPKQLESWAKQFAAECRSTERVIFGLLGGKGGAGFGSSVSSILNGYLLTLEPTLASRWRYQIITQYWKYEPLDSFFLDAPALYGCSMYNNSKDYPKYRFQLSYLNGSIQLAANESITIENVGHMFPEFRNGMRLTEQREGKVKMFKKKSTIVKAVWQPHSDLKSLMWQLWQSLMSESEGYFALHVRRTDKIAAREMGNIPVKKFSDKILHLCQNGMICPRKVFVMADEEESVRQLRRQLPTFSVVTILDALHAAHLPIEGNYVALPAKHPQNVPTSNRTYWRTHTKQIILEITLLAMADYLICTMSSNVCRLAAALKGNYTIEGHVFAIDGLQWTTI